MKIVHIIPGSGGSFYCGNCLRDSKLFDSLRAEGLDAIKIPMYLPLFANDHGLQEVPVFYGAVSIYLKQQYPIFRNAPVWVDKILNSLPMLRFAARMANSTRATGLEEMTISMLKGEHGEQKDELEKMAHWLSTHLKPDVIHISNALLLGLAHKLKEYLDVPVVCSLQDEDVWVDVMHPDIVPKVWQLMKEKAEDVDMFIPVSHYYTSFMKERLSLPAHKMSTLHLGVDPADYIYKNASDKQRTIGYLSRLCRENGLDVLVDAFILLKRIEGNEDIRLLLTGGYTGDDHHFLKEQKRKLKEAGVLSQVEFIGEFGEKGRAGFFNRVQVLSVPVHNGEAFGIYLTEAMAAGIPVVQPALGAFPEIIESSKGGITYPANTPEELAGALNKLLNDRNSLSVLSTSARQSIIERFNIHSLAKEMHTIYDKVIQDYKSNKNNIHANISRESLQDLPQEP
jgi:glycosyltransferase involved in cell wall biosynthesis